MYRICANNPWAQHYAHTVNPLIARLSVRHVQRVGRLLAMHSVSSNEMGGDNGVWAF